MDISENISIDIALIDVSNNINTDISDNITMNVSAPNDGIISPSSTNTVQNEDSTVYTLDNFSDVNAFPDSLANSINYSFYGNRESINNSIYDIANKYIKSTSFGKIMAYIGIQDDTVNVLTLLQTKLKHFINEKFPNCNTCTEIHIRHKTYISTYAKQLYDIMKSIPVNDDETHEIYKLYNETMLRFGSIDMCDDNSRDSIIFKFNHLIDICVNIVILMYYWRKDNESIETCFNNYITFLEELIRDFLLPYVRDINSYIDTTDMCETRILTGHYDETQRPVSRPHTPRSSRQIYRSDSLDDYNTPEQSVNNITGTRKQISFDQLSAIIGESYGNNPNLECSTSLDIICSYLRGQKQLYIEAKNYSEKYLNALSLPTIIISAAVGLLTLLVTSRLGIIIVAILSAVNAVIISIVSYLKLDAKAEAHRTSAYHFEKLETTCSFLSGRIMFFDANEGEDIENTIKEIETKIKEIKEVNQFVLPEHVRRMYPKTYNSNIFADVKKLYVKEVILKNNLKNVINDIILKQRKHNKTPEDVCELEELKKTQDRLMNEILGFKAKYLDLDKSLKYEIKRSDYFKKIRAYTCLNLINMCCCNVFGKCITLTGPKKPSDYSSEATEMV